jgi:DNA processing protein
VAAGAGALAAAGLAESAVRAIVTPASARIDAAAGWLAVDPVHHLIAHDDPRYPPRLAETQTAPAVLFVRGDPDCLLVPQLAIVGSRQATPAGIENSRAFAAHLAARGLTITSGLALGVDAAAHRGALDGGGLTVAVLGAGPDQAYPRANARLALDIVAAGGALVSEFLPGVAPLRANFPRRNRIVSGLALGTLVVEAGVQSGALITARRAIEQGRDVFAIPGSIHNPLAKGCHQLIRDGAKLVESAEHILEELAPLLAGLRPRQGNEAQHAATAQTLMHAADDADYARLLNALGWDPADVDTLVARSGLTAAEVSSMLLILELEGSVQPLPGGRYQRHTRETDRGRPI